MSYWNKHEAAKAWKVSPDHARLMMRKMPEAVRVVNDRGSTAWCVPAGTPKPVLSDMKKASRAKGSGAETLPPRKLAGTEAI